MLKPKYLLFSLLFVLNLNAIDVLIAKYDLQYKQKITYKNVIAKDFKSIKKNCTPLVLKDINSRKFVTKHFIRKNKIICTKDIELYKSNTILFNFGQIEIEKHGKIIYENNKLVKIKKNNGKIEKIYKDGRINE